MNLEVFGKVFQGFDNPKNIINHEQKRNRQYDDGNRRNEKENVRVKYFFHTKILAHEGLRQNALSTLALLTGGTGIELIHLGIVLAGDHLEFFVEGVDLVGELVVVFNFFIVVFGVFVALARFKVVANVLDLF